jgi:hypothetical protein
VRVATRLDFENIKLTAVVANKGKVAAVFGYQSLNETDVPAVHEALMKALAKK